MFSQRKMPISGVGIPVHEVLNPIAFRELQMAMMGASYDFPMIWSGEARFCRIPYNLKHVNCYGWIGSGNYYELYIEICVDDLRNVLWYSVCTTLGRFVESPPNMHKHVFYDCRGTPFYACTGDAVDDQALPVFIEQQFPNRCLNQLKACGPVH